MIDELAPGFSFHCRLSPRFGEFDAGGVLYHANYFHLYESAREAFLQENGIPYKGFVAASSHLAVIESHQSFVAPVVYGEELSAAVWISELRGASAVFNYGISRTETGKLVHRAWTKHAFIRNTPSGFRVEPFPSELKALFKKFAK